MKKPVMLLVYEWVGKSRNIYNMIHSLLEKSGNLNQGKSERLKLRKILEDLLFSCRKVSGYLYKENIVIDL